MSLPQANVHPLTTRLLKSLLQKRLCELICTLLNKLLLLHLISLALVRFCIYASFFLYHFLC